ncbi:hypothetical protein HMPREF3038_01969 [Akkermansia sp. KLE1797]|nr:hypothetical protein HMPREF3038_01969 [Akkermansia sp. KLE1797]KZA06037.1 hypothetical protein HMPREF1326_00301 [Akkermansia sp. KLE1605]
MTPCRSFFIIRPDTNQRKKCRLRRIILVFLEKACLFKEKAGR